jgi:hypothetical protein
MPESSISARDFTDARSLVPARGCNHASPDHTGPPPKDCWHPAWPPGRARTRATTATRRTSGSAHHRRPVQSTCHEYLTAGRCAVITPTLLSLGQQEEPIKGSLRRPTRCIFMRCRPHRRLTLLPRSGCARRTWARRNSRQDRAIYCLGGGPRPGVSRRAATRSPYPFVPV